MMTLRVHLKLSNENLAELERLIGWRPDRYTVRAWPRATIMRMLTPADNGKPARPEESPESVSPLSTTAESVEADDKPASGVQ